MICYVYRLGRKTGHVIGHRSASSHSDFTGREGDWEDLWYPERRWWSCSFLWSFVLFKCILFKCRFCDCQFALLFRNWKFSSKNPNGFVPEKWSIIGLCCDLRAIPRISIEDTPPSWCEPKREINEAIGVSKILNHNRTEERFGATTRFWSAYLSFKWWSLVHVRCNAHIQCFILEFDLHIFLGVSSRTN